MSSSQHLPDDIFVENGLILNAVSPLVLYCEALMLLTCHTYSFVFTDTKFMDLCSTSHFTGAVPLIESQIAKQEYHLAAWLNLLFDGANQSSQFIPRKIGLQLPVQFI
ncbi:hypothetical protein C8J56DRAFT_1065259 [Mycena floridula]|nr:hypothetical protein C8J56DRAFT_1065259 [Mycena floridula]